MCDHASGPLMPNSMVPQGSKKGVMSRGPRGGNACLVRTGIRQSLRASDARAVEFFFPNLLLPQQAPRWFEQVLGKVAAAAIDAATAGEPRNLDFALAELVASECQGCTLLNAGCAKDALFTSHMGASCPIPSGAFGQCPACQQEECDVGCVQRQYMRLIRATFLALVLAAFRVDDLKSALAIQISRSVKVWAANNTLALLNARPVVVEGVAVPTLNKRSLATFTGWLRVEQDAAGLQWMACGAADQGALSLSSFLRKFATVNLAGYSGAQVSAVRPRDVAGGGGGAGGAGGAGAGAAEMAELQRQVQNLQRLNQQHEENVQSLVKANEALRGSSTAMTGSGAVFQPILRGSKFGQIDARNALAWGKCFLTLENVLCSVDAVRNGVSSTYLLVPSLCDACEPGKNKEQKIRIHSFPVGLAHVDIPLGLEFAWAGKFAEFQSMLKQFGSEAVMCDNFYTVHQFLNVHRLLEKEAQRLHERALGDKSDLRTPIKCSLIKIVEVGDMIIKALLDDAFRYGKVIDPTDARNLVVLEGLQSVGPTFAESLNIAPRMAPTKPRSKRTQHEERVGEAVQPPSKTFKERRAAEICFKFNSNEQPCGGIETCPMGRKHVCSKCKGNHAQSLTPACK